MLVVDISNNLDMEKLADNQIPLSPVAKLIFDSIVQRSLQKILNLSAGWMIQVKTELPSSKTQVNNKPEWAIGLWKSQGLSDLGQVLLPQFYFVKIDLRRNNLTQLPIELLRQDTLCHLDVRSVDSQTQFGRPLA